MLTPIPNPIAARRDDAAQASRSLRGADQVPLAFDDPDPGIIDWGDLAEAAAEDAEGREGAGAQVSLCVAARIAEDRLGDPLTAVGHLEAALARAGGAPLMPVLRGLRDLALEAGSILGAIDALDQEVVASASNARRADLLVEKASLFADHLLLPIPARAAVEEALRLAAGHTGALGVGQALAERAHNPVWLRTILEQRLAAGAKPAERARVLVRLAMAAESDVGLAERAAAIGYLGRALDEDGGGDAAAVARAA